METDLLPGEKIVRHSKASLQRHLLAWGGVSGHLTLTNQRVVFEPDKVKRKRGPEAFNRDDIISVSNAWTWINGAPRIPNAVKVKFRDGRKVRFGVPERKDWREAISTGVGTKDVAAAGSSHVASSPSATPAPEASAADDDVFDQIRKLGELRDAGVVTEEEFNAKKAELLKRL